MPAPISEEEADRIIGLREWVEQDVRWSQAEGFQRFRVPVGCDEGYLLRIIGTLTVATGYVRYNLFVGDQPIRMLHIGKDHRNPEGTRVGRRHKHRWTEVHVGDLLFTMRYSADAPFREEVEELLVEHQIRHETDRRVSGRSGQQSAPS